MRLMFLVMITALAFAGLPLVASEDEGSMASNLDDASIFTVGKTGMTPGVGVGAQTSTPATPMPLGTGVPVVASFQANDSAEEPVVKSTVKEVKNATSSQEASLAKGTGEMASLAGNWSVLLPDEVTVDLSLFQVDSVVFGTGSLTQVNYTQELVASGSVQGQNATLYLMDLTGASLYLLNLTVEDQEASGDFTLYGQSGVIVRDEISGFGY
ncbi:MAG TPA: hypothetical protein PLI05_07610 [Methanotrichaceae archaeon]|nr:hypothetical protein [Methanotrichaceae archaeon]HQI91484.1 hypothetical protein [Methanotrichaceae archaeon]HQJ28822.1 hypothetical protein [Methanotrichaceae archaeon]